MNSKIIISILSITSILLAGLVVYLHYQLNPDFYQKSDEEVVLSISASDIELNGLQEGDTISSPFTVSGVTSSAWFDGEKELLVEVLDESGAVLGTAYAEKGATVSGTSNVRFSADVTYLTAPVERPGFVSFTNYDSETEESLENDPLSQGVSFQIGAILVAEDDIEMTVDEEDNEGVVDVTTETIFE